MPRLIILYFEAGGGHRAAALAIQEVLSRSSENWEIELLNLQEYLDELDPVRRLTGIRLQDVCNQLLSKGYTRYMKQLLPVLHLAVRIFHPQVVKKLAIYWEQSRPDIVLSVAPNLNRSISCSLRRSTVQFVTVITDLCDTPPHFWIERESQYIVCGSQKAAEQALAMKHSRERVLLVSGMIMHPRFYEEQRATRDQLRVRFGLKQNLTTVLIMFGGEGSTDILDVAESLNRCSVPIQSIFICGRNDAVKKRLEQMQWNTPRLILGFTKEVPLYMRASDLMIGKPGPGSISEALHFGLPVIVCRNEATMPQEVYNTYWVEEQGFGAAVSSFKNVGTDLERLMVSGRLSHFQEIVRRTRNNAIFEVEPLLLKIWSERSAAGRVNAQDTNSRSVVSGSVVSSPSV